MCLCPPRVKGQQNSVGMCKSWVSSAGRELGRGVAVSSENDIYSWLPSLTDLDLLTQSGGFRVRQEQFFIT